MEGETKVEVENKTRSGYLLDVLSLKHNDMKRRVVGEIR